MSGAEIISGWIVVIGFLMMGFCILSYGELLVCERDEDSWLQNFLRWVWRVG